MDAHLINFPGFLYLLGHVGRIVAMRGSSARWHAEQGGDAAAAAP